MENGEWRIWCNSIDNGVWKNRKLIYMSTTMPSSTATCVSCGPCIFGKWLHFQLFSKRKEKHVEPCVKKRKYFFRYYRNSDCSAIQLIMQLQYLENLCDACIEIWRLKKLTNWEWSYSKPDSTETEKILIRLVYYHLTATCVSMSTELVTLQICFMNRDVWWCY